MKRKPKPSFPYEFVFNDSSTATARRYAQRAKVRFVIGPHQDGSRGEVGLFVHGEDALKLRRFFKSYGMLMEADCAFDARKSYREHMTNETH